jgi:hypothetical protein
METLVSMVSNAPLLLLIGGVFHNYIRNAIDVVCNWVVTKCVVCCQVTNCDSRMALNRLVLHHDKRRVVNKVERPQCGTYVIWDNWIPVILTLQLYEGSTQYFLYVPSFFFFSNWAVQRLQAFVVKAEDSVPKNHETNRIITARFIHSKDINSCPVFVHYPNKMQQNLLDHVVLTFPKLLTQSYSILLSGSPGLGKTHMGRILAHHYYRVMQKDTYLFEATLSNPQVLWTIWENTRHVDMTIVVINEIDVAWEKSMKEPVGAPVSLEERPTTNKMTMNNFMDLIHDIPGCIFLFTTNVSIAELKTKYPCYTRPGRIDYCCEFTVTPDVDVKKVVSKFRIKTKTK